MSPGIVISDLSFRWPDGEVLFDGLSATFGPGRTGLIGANGSGKTALLRLAAGVLAPARGSADVTGTLGYLPQGLTLRAGLRVDERDGAIRIYGGNLAAYEQAVATEQEAAGRSVRAAESDLRRQRRELADAQTKLARRSRYGQKIADSGSQPRIVMGARKRQAQVSAGKHRILHAEKVAGAQQRLAEAEEALREDEEIQVDLPATEVPAGRTVLSIRGALLRCGARADLEVRGPERIALLGGNGSGKTTLLQAITGQVPPLEGTVKAAVPLRYLPQRLDLLDESASVAANVARFAPGASGNAIRSRLARFAFRGDRAGRAVETLSGGERFRAALAALLLAEPAPQLLLLDEPTNNLDMASTRQLPQALAGYRGALVVASHDVPFLRDAGITRWLRLDGELSETGPP